TCIYWLVSAPSAFADPVTLRPRIEATGAAITLGDVFDGAGAVAGRPIGPAPAPGQISTLPVSLLSAGAPAAGLEGTPPTAVNAVQVVHPAGARATLPPTSSDRTVADAAIHRGEPVTLVYEAPGLQLTMRTRALEDAAVGQGV